MKLFAFFFLSIQIFDFAYSLNHNKNGSKPHRNKKSANSNDLYYYYKFEKGQNFAPNPKIPLEQHYKNERNLRKKFYHLKDDMQHMKMEEGFKVRDLSRSVLALENDLNTLKTQNGAIHKLHLQ